MDYMKIVDAAEIWNVSVRRVQILCKSGAIEGAIRMGRDWMIPVDAKRPTDGRRKENLSTEAVMSDAEPMAEEEDPDEDMPLPRKTPFLTMTDLYNQPGGATESAIKLSGNHEARILFEAEIAYARGDIDAVYKHASYLLQKHSGPYAVLSAGMLLGLCAAWKGDVEMWNQAKQHIGEAPWKTDLERDILLFTLTALDSTVYDVRSFPEWFKIGNFEPLHPDALPAAKVFYARYLYSAGYGVATKIIDVEGVQGLTLMNMLPYTVEPMVSQARADKSILAELYLRLICASIYYYSGNRTQAIRHLDRAITLALPDRLYGVLAEHRRMLDSLLDERLGAVDPEAVDKVQDLYQDFIVGFAKLRGYIQNRSIDTTLSVREREIAKLAAFGMSNAEIAERLHLSLASVKQTVRTAIYKTGVENKAALATVL
ncbi:MAG: hypothetical protein IJX28_07275 [Clostridia bacterium]|nr:hypothetical protein [Clostridia bacterium]